MTEVPPEGISSPSASVVVAVVALHSVLLGIGLSIEPIRTLSLVGWDYEGPVFFPSQSGFFLVILGGAYFAGLRFRPFAWFLVATKVLAVIFLVSAFFFGAGPRALLLAAVSDGAMGAAVAYTLTRKGCG